MERERLIQAIAPTKRDAEALEWSWDFWGRPKQKPPPGAWSTWLILAGRGFGKTRSGAEWIRDRVEAGVARRVYLVGATAADVRDVMVEGESGLLAISPPWNRPVYEPSKRRLSWPNGATAITFSAEEPKRLRGPQADTAWGDEITSWKYPETWDQLQFGLRLGTDPRAVVTTTPRPTPELRALIADKGTVITRGSTFENKGNLDAKFLERIRSKYEGTRLGRQELYAELLEDIQGALWKRGPMIDALRVVRAPVLRRVVVAIDPAVADPSLAKKNATAETGIIVAGVSIDGHGYVLDDLSGHHTPAEWAKIACNAYKTYGADRIIAEVNNGGSLVEANIRTVDKNVSYRGVHASRGKRARAEPVSALYEQNKIHHVGSFGALEDQLCTWDSSAGERSPDRLDALVWAFAELMLGSGGTFAFSDNFPSVRSRV